MTYSTSPHSPLETALAMAYLDPKEARKTSSTNEQNSSGRFRDWD